MASDADSFDPVHVLGVLLIAILLNAYFFGFVCQQLYSYWISRFDDPVHVRAFVVAQFCIVALQGAILWNFAWNIYIISFDLITDPKSITWQAFANSLCQVVLIMMANVFLVDRLYKLTQSRLQSGLVLAFSSMAFIFGVVNLSTTWKRSNLQKFTPGQLAASGIWHGFQAIAECLITFFLTRALLTSRSGMRRSNSVVHHFVRNAIQIGVFATLWSLAALGTYFLLPRWTIYTVFDMTSGSIYTHMIFDGLLSRTRLRSRLAERSELEVGFPSQSNSHSLPSSQAFEGKRTTTAVHGAVSLVTMADFRTGSQVTEDLPSNEKDANSDLEGEPSKEPGAGDDLSV